MAERRERRKGGDTWPRRGKVREAILKSRLSLSFDCVSSGSGSLNEHCSGGAAQVARLDVTCVL